MASFLLNVVQAGEGIWQEENAGRRMTGYIMKPLMFFHTAITSHIFFLTENTRSANINQLYISGSLYYSNLI